MTATDVGLKKAFQVNFGIETVAGTLVPATHRWLGPVTVQPEDAIAIPEHDQGILGDLVVEDPYVESTGTTLALAETMFSVEQFAYWLATSIKGVTSSSGTTPFLLDNFVAPTDPALINTTKTLSWEWTDGIQAYAAAYGFCEKWTVSADENSNGGILKMSATFRARKRATSTITASMVPLSGIAPLNIKRGTVKLDSLGTAAGTASATSNWIKAFKIEYTSGWIPDGSMSGGSDTDFNRAVYNGMHGLTGSLTCAMTAQSITEIANARTPQGRIMQLLVPGAGTRKLTMNLPLAYTKDPEWGAADRKGLHMVTFEFRGGYSRTATVQGMSFPLNMAASTTLS